MASGASAATIENQLRELRMRVDFDTYDISIQQLISMIEAEQIDIAPSYQRQFRWDPLRQCQLVESVFLGIPVPSLYMATNKDGTWEAIDGVQRLSTLTRFCGTSHVIEKMNVGSSLLLDGLTKLTKLNGLAFSQLPQNLQTQFLLRPVKVTTLNDKSDFKVRFDLFERLNSGGIRLSQQEIRACVFRGEFNNFLEELAQNENFKKVVRLQDSQEKDATREEMVLRFFAFYHCYKKFDHSVEEFLNEFMEHQTKPRPFDYAKNRALFLNSFGALAKALPEGIRRNRALTPVNLYESVAVGAALAMGSKRKLVTKDLSWIQSPELRELTTGATNSNKRVVGRIEFAAKKFGAAL